MEIPPPPPAREEFNVKFHGMSVLPETSVLTVCVLLLYKTSLCVLKSASSTQPTVQQASTGWRACKFTKTVKSAQIPELPWPFESKTL
jgi:hypothetical protein